MLKSVKIVLNFRASFSSAARLASTTADRRTPVITCKRTQFNQFVDQFPSSAEPTKFGSLELVSSGWRHRKATGDYFIIHPVRQPFEAHALSEVSFRDLGVREELVENLKQRHALFPTAYQAEAMPAVLNGDHVLLAAETGCGKTYSYLVPIVEGILRRKLNGEEREFNSPLVLIMTPGRELAQQIGRVVEGLTRGLDITSRVLLGGRTCQQMLNPHFEEVDILVASFGAISKLITSGIYRTDAVRWVVLDEADTLLDDSFNAKLLHLMKRFPFHKNHLQDLGDNVRGTQLVLAAATMPTNMDELLGRLVNIETMEEVVSPNLHRLMTHVSQRFMRVTKQDRPQILLDLVRKDIKRQRPLIIFSNKTATCDFVSIQLNEAGIPCVNLNGDMLLKIRLGQFEKFQQAEVNVLSTTDVASRGLDTTRAAHVINFDFPLYAADYIHRIGRIGRVGSRGDCLVTNLVSSQAEIDAVQRVEHSARANDPLANVNANVKETSKTLITSSFILARRGETVFIRSSRSLSRRTISFRDQQFNPAFRANSPKKNPRSCCFSTQSDPPSKSSPVFAMTSVTFRLGKAFHVPLVRNLATTSALARDGSSESWLSKLLVRKIEPTKESHSRMLSDKEIIYELHTHNIRPDSVGKYLENYKKSVEIVSSKKDLTIELIGSWNVDVGDLDQCLHLWRYTGGFEMVDQSKKVLCSDPDYVQLTQERGTYLRSRHLQYLLAFSYWPQLALRQDKNIYEIRSYRLKPGTMIEWGNNWARAINYRQNNDEAFAGFFSQIGRLYNVHHIWCYKDLLSRKETRESAWRSPGWDECVAYTVPLIREMHTRILTPTDFSPTQ